MTSTKKGSILVIMKILFLFLISYTLTLGTCTSVSIPAIQLGTNYYSKANYPKGGVPCLSSNDTNYIMANPQAIFEFSLAQSFSSLENALGVDVSTSVGWGMFSLDARAQYASSQKQSSYDLNLNYIFQYAAQAILKLDEAKLGREYLSSVGALHYDNGSEDFLEYCGDSFIQEAQAGITLIVTYNLHFQNQVDKETFQANIQADYGSMVSVSTQIKQATEKSRVSITLNLKAIQLGGNPERLQDILGESQDGQYTILECGKYNPSEGNELDTSPCIDVINKIIDYAHAQGSYQDTGLQTQIRVDDTGSPINPNAFYYTNPVATPWAQINAQPNIEVPAQEISDVQKNLTDWFKADTRNLAFVKNYIPLLDSLSTSNANAVTSLKKIQESLEGRISSYNGIGVMDCFVGGHNELCIQKHNIMMTKREVDYPIDEETFAIFNTAYITSKKDILLPYDFDGRFRLLSDYIEQGNDPSMKFVSLDFSSGDSPFIMYYNTGVGCSAVVGLYDGTLDWYVEGGSDCYEATLSYSCTSDTLNWKMCRIENPM